MNKILKKSLASILSISTVLSVGVCSLQASTTYSYALETPQLLSNRYYYTTTTTDEELVTTITVTEEDISAQNIQQIIFAAGISIAGLAFELGNWYYGIGVPGEIDYYRTITYRYKVDNLTKKKTLVGEEWDVRLVATTNSGKSKSFTRHLRVK